MVAAFVNIVITLVILGAVLGLLLYLVRIAPIPEPFKGWLNFAVIALAVIVLILLLLSLLDGGTGGLHFYRPVR